MDRCTGYNALRCNQAFYALRVNDYLLSAGAENLHSNGDRWNEEKNRSNAEHWNEKRKLLKRVI